MIVANMHLGIWWIWIK
uniref:Uncharacterized protein n=1 Tax=Arundo donax TaxID=35708 RepID=A0A0A9FP23_ARUDO